MGTALGPKYIPYTYMDPLGNGIINGRGFGLNQEVIIRMGRGVRVKGLNGFGVLGFRVWGSRIGV